ncbi:MAG TPA: hypothetical protein VJJ83_01635, partial [Candidatus Babeliales bacterium]|nr:hypothetical protein [Candidatus Babeliales bacterium]
MWRWQPSVPYRYGIFWAQLIGLVLLLHLGALYSLLFITPDLPLSPALTIRATFANGELPVVFMPLYKHVPGALQQLNQPVAKTGAAQTKRARTGAGYYVKARRLQPTRANQPVKQIKSVKVKAAKINPAGAQQKRVAGSQVAKVPVKLAKIPAKALRVTPVLSGSAGAVTAKTDPSSAVVVKADLSDGAMAKTNPADGAVAKTELVSPVSATALTSDQAVSKPDLAADLA